eukprot:54954-Eustigmatos_ZCMA.PRE.1
MEHGETRIRDEPQVLRTLRDPVSTSVSGRSISVSFSSVSRRHIHTATAETNRRQIARCRSWIYVETRRGS